MRPTCVIRKLENIIWLFFSLLTFLVRTFVIIKPILKPIKINHLIYIEAAIFFFLLNKFVH